MSLFPTDPQKIKTQITRYERELRKEYETHRFIDDSSGKRYLLGPLYLLLGDVAGAIKSFAWFEQMFPDDMGEPAHTLCWTLGLYRAGDKTGATQKLLHTMLSNPSAVRRATAPRTFSCGIFFSAWFTKLPTHPDAFSASAVFEPVKAPTSFASVCWP